MTPTRTRSSWGLRQIGISPKVKNPALILAAAGAVLAVLDLLGVVNVEDELWLTLLGAGGVTFGVGYKSDPGEVVKDTGGVPPYSDTPYSSERGLVDTMFLLGLLTAAVVVLLIVVFA